MVAFLYFTVSSVLLLLPVNSLVESVEENLRTPSSDRGSKKTLAEFLSLSLLYLKSEFSVHLTDILKAHNHSF